VPVILIVGQKIAQVVFVSCGETNTPYSMKGSYQTTDNIDDLIANWTPEAMLPKAKSFI
jgi:deoxycytidine triphosphate deaminase